jgi:hypothetical protein
MIKKMLQATVMLATLLFFVSCQDNNEAKKNPSNGNKASDKMMQKGNMEKNNNAKPTFRNTDAEQKCDTCPKEKCCSSSEKQEVVLPKEEKTISQEVKPEASLPLEEFKTSLNDQNKTPDITTNVENVSPVEKAIPVEKAESVEVHQ